MIEVSINGKDDEGLTAYTSADIEDADGLRLFAEHSVFRTLCPDYHAELRWAKPKVPADKEPILASWNCKTQKWKFKPLNIKRAFAEDGE